VPVQVSFVRKVDSQERKSSKGRNREKGGRNNPEMKGRIRQKDDAGRLRADLGTLYAKEEPSRLKVLSNGTEGGSKVVSFDPS